MKRFTFSVVVLFFLFGVSIVYAGENISGIWDEQNSNPEVTHITNIITQFGNKIVVSAYYEWRGAHNVWSGSGTINGNKVEFTVNYSKKTQFQYDGKKVFTLSADGKTLTGNWYDNKGNSGPNIMVKQR